MPPRMGRGRTVRKNKKLPGGALCPAREKWRRRERDENQKPRTENYTISSQKSMRTPNCADRGVLHCVNTCPKAPELQFVFGLQ
jgi:hypothetical protein